MVFKVGSGSGCPGTTGPLDDSIYFFTHMQNASYSRMNTKKERIRQRNTLLIKLAKSPRQHHRIG
jgi:hypothetical protein